MAPALRILFLAAEADPFIKIGGLGDVAGSLPQALVSTGNVDIRLAIPFHGAIQRQAYALQLAGSVEVAHTSGALKADILTTVLNGLPVYLVGGGPIHPDDPVYTTDTAVDGQKYTFFSLAILEYLRQTGWIPDVIHANDWHTAPALYSMRIQRRAAFRSTAALLGLHNLPYLGVGAGPAMNDFGLPAATGSPLPAWAKNMPLPIGLWIADHIVAVSPTYAREILTPEFGSGLDEYLKTRADSISGILNGLNTELWNPETDHSLVANYSAQSLSQRQDNKLALLQEFHFDPNPGTPLLAMVGRMDPQKGVDLVPDALRSITHLPWNAIILGTGTPTIEDAARQLEANFPERVRTVLRFDTALSHRIYAGADMLLIPSRYEPCGLTQMIAMRYGCVPVARATGGLKDTIQDFQPDQPSTGFLFQQADAKELAAALERAIQVFPNHETWLAIQENGLSQDFSWNRFAHQYLSLYQTLVDHKRRYPEKERPS